MSEPLSTSTATVPGTAPQQRDLRTVLAPHAQQVGQRLRDLRVSRMQTQDEFAALLEARLGVTITRSMLANYETGRRSIPAELLVVIASVCAVPLDIFVGNASQIDSMPEEPWPADDLPAVAPPAPGVTAVAPGTSPTATALDMIAMAFQERPDIVPDVLDFVITTTEQPPRQ